MANNLKGLDADQVIRSVYDVDKNCLRVCITDPIDGGGSGIEVAISHTEDSIRLGDGTSFITSTTVGPKLGYDVYIINEDLDIRDLDASQDNVAIQDSDGDELEIEPNGSINVNVIPSATAVTTVNKYGESNSLAASTESTIITHTGVVGKSTFLQKASVNGTNIAVYKIKVNGVVIEKKHTQHGGPLNLEINFDGILNNGYLIGVGDTVIITVEHSRMGQPGDFDARLQLIEI